MILSCCIFSLILPSLSHLLSEVFRNHQSVKHWVNSSLKRVGDKTCLSVSGVFTPVNGYHNTVQ